MSVHPTAAGGTPQTNPYTPAAGGASPGPVGHLTGAAGGSPQGGGQQGALPQEPAAGLPAQSRPFMSPQPAVDKVKPPHVVIHYSQPTPAKPLNGGQPAGNPSGAPGLPLAQTLRNSVSPAASLPQSPERVQLRPLQPPPDKELPPPPLIKLEATHQTTRSPAQDEEAVIEIDSKAVTERKSLATALPVPTSEAVSLLERERFVSRFDEARQPFANEVFDQGLAVYWHLMNESNDPAASVRPSRAMELLSLYREKVGDREFEADPQRALETIAYYLDRRTSPEQLRAWVEQGDQRELTQLGLPIAHAYSHGFMAMGVLSVLMARYALSYDADPQLNAQESYAVNLSIIAAGGTYAQRANALTGWGPKYLQMYVYDGRNQRVPLNEHWKGYLATCVMFWGFVITHPTSSYIADGDAQVSSQGKLFGAICDTVMAMVTLSILQRLVAHKDHALLNATPGKTAKVEELIAHLQATEGWGGALCTRLKEWCKGWGGNFGWPTGEAMSQLLLHAIGSLFTTFPYLVAACMTPKSQAAKNWMLAGDIWVGPGWGPGHRFAKDALAWWKNRRPAAVQTPAPVQVPPAGKFQPNSPVAGGKPQAEVAGGKHRSIRSIDLVPQRLTASLFEKGVAANDDAAEALRNLRPVFFMNTEQPVVNPHAQASSSTTTRTPARTPAATSISTSSSSSSSTTTNTDTNTPDPHRPPVERKDSKDSKGVSAPDFSSLTRQETHDE